MALKDAWKALIGTKEEKSLTTEEKGLLASDEFPIVYADDVNMANYKKIPLTSLAALGTSFAQLPASARTVVQSVHTSVDIGKTLFVGVNPKSVPGFLIADKNGTVGNILRYNEQGKRVIAGRMRFQPLDAGLPVTQTTSTIVPFDPAGMMLAVALMNIEVKLGEIQKKTEEILRFLELKEQTKQRGNLNALSEIMDEYKRNGDNEKICALRSVEVQTIKREANQSILLYQERIAAKLKNPQAIHGVRMAQTLMDGVINEFREFQLASYLYSFASFLEVVLHRSFGDQALDAVADKMDEYDKRYAALYAACRQQIAQYRRTSIEAQAVGKVGSMAKTLGKAIESVPVLRNGSVDEALIGAGEALGKRNKEATLRMVEQFEPLSESRMKPFVENIRAVNALYNEPRGMLMDEENLYVLQPA